MPLAHLPPNLLQALLALEPTTTILPTAMLLAHPPPDVQPALLALDSNSTILPAPMPPTHPSISSNSSPAA